MVKNSKINILIVDDNRQNIRLIGDMLGENKDYSLSVATSGEHAIRIARKIIPDLILLDIVMQDLDGYQVCEILKSDPETSHIPIIFQTAERAETKDIVKGFAVGGSDYLTKPFSAAELNARVKTHIALKQAIDAVRASERRYRAVVEDMTELVCRFTPKGRLLFVNDAYCRYFKKTRKQLMRMSFLDLLPVRDREGALDHLRSMSPENPIAAYEHRVEDGSGDVRWQHWTDRAIFDEKGVIKEIQSVGRDITDRVHLEEAYRNLVDYSHQGMTIFQDGRCVFANQKMGEIAGCNVDELTNMSLEAFKAMIHPQDLINIQDYFNDQIPDGQLTAAANPSLRGAGGCSRFIEKTGQVRWLDFQFAFVEYWGKPAIQIAVMDITRVKELETLLAQRQSFHSMIGTSPVMQRVYTIIEQLGPTNLTILLTGETGTGKELAAEALHAESLCSNGPMVKINCAELSENLIESELFGHTKGAFTGADRTRTGRFQMAEGGTLFLDEIGDLSLNVQTKLLRVIEQRQIQRVGDTGPITVNVRVIAATNANLSQLVVEGKFREDLFFRLNGSCIHLPPLRDRVSDITQLFEYFLCRFGDQHKILRTRSDVYEMLQDYAWPGNVRELKNVIHTACAVCPDTILTPEDFPDNIRKLETLSTENPSSDRLETDPSMLSEEQKILNTLAQCKWHKGRAAEILGISRSTLYRRMLEYGIE